jgi:hypothetical protein
MLATTFSNGVDFRSREVILIARRPRLFVTA